MSIPREEDGDRRLKEVEEDSIKRTKTKEDSGVSGLSSWDESHPSTAHSPDPNEGNEDAER